MRTRYLSLFISFSLSLSVTQASFAQDISKLGGDLTSDLPGRNAIQVNAPNVTDEQRRLTQLGGFAIFHGAFTKDGGLGPNFVNSSCGGCHVDNGRGPTKFSEANLGGSTMVVKVSLPGLHANGSPRNVPGVGEQLLDQSVKGSSKIHIKLLWDEVKGSYPDGTTYKLRRPNLVYRIDGMSRRKLYSSLRMTPPVIGPGLLEAVPESEILQLDDPNDLDGDGISGHPNYVIDGRTGLYAIGRFGFKASHTTTEQQTTAALFNDIGINNPILSVPNKPLEITQVELNFLVLYQKLAGVPRALNQDDSHVVSGKSLFQIVGCDKCHRMTLTTGTYVDPELSNQTFHPFTDLLLHDMGLGLADKRAEFSAKGSEWRTTALWGLGFSKQLAGRRAVFLHDGRARTIEEAILWHDGEAAQALLHFQSLTKDQRDDLIAFLNSL